MELAEKYSSLLFRPAHHLEGFLGCVFGLWLEGVIIVVEGGLVFPSKEILKKASEPRLASRRGRRLATSAPWVCK